MFYSLLLIQDKNLSGLITWLGKTGKAACFAVDYF